MVKTSNDAQVLISGAGPSGLMMALMLSRYHIPVRIIDMTKERAPYSRALAVQIRTLEIFSSLDLLKNLQEHAEKVQGIQFNNYEQEPIDVMLGDSIQGPFTPWMVEQPYTEKLLEDALLAYGITVERGVTLIEYGTCENGFRAVLESEDGKSIHECKYLIGADGAHSVVRKMMPSAFSGSTYEEAFILADAECEADFDHDTLRFFFRDNEFLAMIPLVGVRHYRLISIRRNEYGREGPPPSIEEFRKLAKSVIPGTMKIDKVRWASRFFVQCRSAALYQKGQAFLVGDSAHVHSPAGGQGMNTGLQDAFNLAFKIAMVERGLATKDLLLSYEMERQPVGEFLIKNTDRLFKLMIGGSLVSRFLRKVLLRYALKSAKAKKNIFRIMSQTAIHYKHGAICTKREHVKLAGMKVGQRIANLPLMDSHLAKTDLHHLALANFFTCFLFFPSNVEKNMAAAMRKDVAQLMRKFAAISFVNIFASDFDAEKIMNELNYYLVDSSWFWNDFSHPFFVIVRADQHIFCQGLPNEMTHAEAALSAWLLPGAL